MSFVSAKSKKFQKSAALAGLATLGLALAIAGCTRKGSKHSAVAPAPAPSSSQDPQSGEFKNGLTIPAGNLPKLAPNATTLRLPGGGLIPVRIINGAQFIQIQATVDGTRFSEIQTYASASKFSSAERSALLAADMGLAVDKITAVATVLDAEIDGDVGYLTAWIPYDKYDALRTVKGLPSGILLNPVVASPMDDNTLPRVQNEIDAGLTALGDGRASTTGFSGLDRIGVPEFLKQVQSEIGGSAVVDGSKVKVGVTDTGITYNHPTFTDDAGKNRIIYMKDYTGEGTVYFSETLKFEVTIPAADDIPAGVKPEEALLLTAEYLMTPPGTGSRPNPEKPVLLEKQLILVNAELRTLLTTPGNGVRLGAFDEKIFMGEDRSDQIDLNVNGKTDDLLWMLHVPSEDGKSNKVYMDLSGTGDFRKAKPVGNFNTTKDVITSYSEKFGFQLKPSVLTGKDDKPFPVSAAAIVGFDAGNHGSHVSGIIAGRKTISNDSDNTLARGVVPNASLMVNRVCANNGGCNATNAIIDLAKNGAEVINMSLGGLNEFNDGYGVQETVVNRLTLMYNTLFVISAGNSGPGRNTMGSPSTARLSMSVGATANRTIIERQYQYPAAGKPAEAANGNDDFMLFFSSRGPTAAGGFKPNLTAPGTELSSIHLNAAPSDRAGLDVYWGTSMSAPTAAGAVALLLDAAKKYNEAHPESALPIDVVTIRSAVIDSAKPFDVASFNPKTGERTKGQYTWIDQGNGMLNLPRAWEALKKARDNRLPSAVNMTKIDGDTSSASVPVQLQYSVRISRQSGNGLKYDGSSQYADPQGLDLAKPAVVRPKFATGIWLDPNATDSLIEVGIARRLPESVAVRSDAGELNRQLVTSADTFEFETVYYGAQKQWLKVGTLNGLDCAKTAVAPQFTLLGVGVVESAVDIDPAATPTPIPSAPLPLPALKASSLMVCVNRTALKALPAGDHGAMIKAYRVVGGKREFAPSFEVPVYMSVPHETLAQKKHYEISRTVKSFGVDRNYIQVPKGTTLVQVKLEVGAPKNDNGALSGCAGVELMALEGGNTLIPKEIVPRTKARAANCKIDGSLNPVEKRTVKFARFQPKPGIWDLHVFGLYQYSESPYTLSVDYARITSSIDQIKGKVDALSGTMTFKVEEASVELTPSESNSQYFLSGFEQETTQNVKQDEKLRVPNADGVVGRQYDDTVVAVTFATGGSKGNDLDLEVLECDDAALEKCKVAESSGTPTDVESAKITPDPKKFYVPVVIGYTVDASKTSFVFTETKNLSKEEKGTVKIEATPYVGYTLTYGFDVAGSTLLKAPEFVSGKSVATGQIRVKTDDGTVMAIVSVKVQNNVAPAPTPAPSVTPVAPAPSPAPSATPASADAL